MDLQSIDPRATAPSAESRKSKSSHGGAFQGVMQMMAKIADNRTAHDVQEHDDETRASRADRPDRKDDARRKDEADRAATRAAMKDKPQSETGETSETDDQTVAAPVDLPQLVQPTGDGAATSETAATGSEVVADPSSPAGSEFVPAPGSAQQDLATASETEAPVPVAAAVQAAAQTAPQGQQKTPSQTAPVQATSQSAAPTAAPAAKPTADENAVLARQAQPQGEQSDAAAKIAGNGQKPETSSGRADALMGAKVTVETPVPVARSQGVSSAVLVQAQQAAASGQAPVSTANGGAGTLHVGGNQPTFVGADGASSNGQGAGQNAGGQNTAGQNAGANAQSQNQGQGQGGQANAQQVGVSFGATIGQRGFGGDASRAQFQEILATRTARAQPGGLAGGEAARPLGSPSSSSTPMTMAGVGGPQSTHTSASLVNRAAATAHGRPGAALGAPADQVAVKLSATAKEGGGKVTIRLTPEELGKVDIKMEISKDGLVRAVVAVDRPETLELLQRDAKGLERILQDAGLRTDGDSLEFDLRGDGGQYAGDTQEQGAGGGSTARPTSDQSDGGELAADDQQGGDGANGVKADGSLDLVA